MIVVSDTGPLVYLVSIGIGQFLPKMYGSVYVPPAVLAELQHQHSPLKDWIAAAPEWLKIETPFPLIPDTSLDPGEREAISLALNLEADVVLIDEKAGRHAAQALGLAVTGTLGVILDGHLEKLFNGLDALDRLAQTNFYASAELLQAVRNSIDSSS